MKNKSQTLLLILLMVFSISELFAQEKEIPKQYNFYEIIKDLERNIDNTEIDSTNDDEIVKLRRFKHYWEARVPANGDMRVYPKAMYEYYTSGERSKTTSSSLCKTDCGDCCMPSNWNFMGPEFIDNRVQNLGKITALWVNPSDPDHLLAGGESGLWKTTDGGNNWSSISDYCLPSIGIFAIAVQPDDLDVIYVGTGYSNGVSHSDHQYGFGVYKTSDGGASWTQMNTNNINPEKSVSHKIIIHPVVYSNVYATVGSRIFKSTNSGNSWVEIFGQTENPAELLLYDMEIVTNGVNDELYVSSYDKHKSYGCIVPPAPGTYNWGNPTAGYCETRYTASVWKFTSPQNVATNTGTVLLNPLLPSYNPVTKLASIAVTPGSVNVGCQTNFDASPASPPAQIKIYRKQNAVSSWSLLATSTAYGLNYGYSFPFDVSSANENIIYYGGTGLNKSTNNGSSFTSLHGYWNFWSNSSGAAAGMHPDMRTNGDLIYSASLNGSADKLYWGNDGGIGRSDDGGATTYNLNGNGLQLSQFYGISNSEVLPNLIYGGTQDNGTFDNKNQDWRNYPFGDGYDAVADANNPLVAYMTMNASFLRKTTNGGGAWGYVSPPEDAGNASLYVEKNANELFLGKKQLWKDNASGGASWVLVGPSPSPGSDIVDIDMSGNGTVKYIAYAGPVWGPANRQKKVYKFDSSGCISGCDLSTNLPGIDWAGITDIATDESGNNLWVSFGGFWEANKKVYHFSNGAWTEFGQGLPNIPTSSLEHYANGLLFLGTDDGVYYRDHTMQAWERYSCNLPNTIISDLEINFRANKLRAATYSRGIWETSINYNLGGNLSCNSSANTSATISPGFPTSYVPSLVDHQTVLVRSKFATVTITISNPCSGTSCCNYADNISWKVYKNNTLYQQGTGAVINFSGQFRKGFWFFNRNEYRVEVTTNCGTDKCGTKTYLFRG